MTREKRQRRVMRLLTMQSDLKDEVRKELRLLRREREAGLFVKRLRR